MNIPLWQVRFDVEVDLSMQVAELAEELNQELPSSAQSKLPGDAAALRGIPALARGVGGTMRQTQPEQETVRRLMARERVVAATTL